jgi:hypothetical protein
MIINKYIIDATIVALKLVRNVRYFRTERGYQGEFFCNLKMALFERGIIIDDLILEMEYQKTRDQHYTGQRPDIILHIPTELSGATVHENNVSVWALKRRATIREAQSDFDKLDEMFETLDYDLGFFINIDSDFHCLELYEGNFKNRLFAFAVRLERNKPFIKHAYFSNGKVKEEKILD